MTPHPSADRLAAVKQDIAAAAEEAGRAVADIVLVAVSKTQDEAAIRPVIAAGQRVFGENRVQEAVGKWPALKAENPDIELHLIGPLQSNKAREAVALFDWIETVDREKIARVLSEECQRQDRKPGFLVQVNTGGEAQKAGVQPREAAAFIKMCREKYHLDIRGVMCIPPVDEEAALHFALLKKIADESGLKVVSMGMSADFDKAIAYGATHVRVGTAIFGPRQKPRVMA
ncbi:MAG: YggS family pyridoxal phosphate-dependent enzyme [Fimbriimonadaceae bacterium]|nr:YggS family pyridoxal phosphate-dependent enzyme [Alphaproteobacteria bacterium]